MLRNYRATLVACLVSGLFVASGIPAGAQEKLHFDIIITNLTPGQYISMPLVVTHKPGLALFAIGDPITTELATFVEEGNPSALGAVLAGIPLVREVMVSSASPLLDTVIGPGRSATVTVETSTDFDQVSVISLLMPTNDAFVALTGVPGPAAMKAVTFFVPAYDAGSERNDELCISMRSPGIPECNGPGGNQRAGGGEGFVHVHNGVHGVGNLSASLRDWRNPVARIVIRRSEDGQSSPAGVGL
ncbi:MAG: spondin domain-containing protein [Candidatus Binatia bacterium]